MIVISKKQLEIYLICGYIHQYLSWIST